MASYPFGNNPWDDQTNTSSNLTGQPVRNDNTSGGYYDNYGTSGYAGGWDDPQQYQYQTTLPQDQPLEQQQQAEQIQPQQQGQGPESSKTFVGSFLRNHVPMAGTCIDAVSTVCSPLTDVIFQHVNKDLLVSKLFYFFFYSAFGSLFPLMGVYFKQQGMNPAQVGILTGVRPVIEIFSAPFWNSIAVRFDKSKALLMFSLISWIVFTVSLAGIRPPASACVAFNDTGFFLYTPYSDDDLMNVDSKELDKLEGPNEMNLASQNTDEVYPDKTSAIKSIKDENKGEILAKEETQDEQRRRRRKRQTQQGREEESKKRYAYHVGEDSNQEKLFNLDVDLENDFDDVMFGAEIRGDKATKLGSSSDRDLNRVSNDDDEDDYDTDVDSKSLAGIRTARYGRSTNNLDGQNAEENDDSESDENVIKSGRTNARNDESNDDTQPNESNDDESEQDKEKEVSPKMKQDKQSGEAEATLSNPLPTSEIAGRQAPINKTRRVHKERDKTPPTHRIGMSPITVEYAVNYNKDKHSQFVTPMFSTIVYKLEDVKGVFFLLLLLISLGEFFSAPALTLADSATLGYLGDNTDLYGRQRMFGSLSWAVTLLLVGMALDNSTSIADHPCGPHHRERSYRVCFLIFSLLMICAFLTATQFRFTRSQRVASKGASQSIVTSATENNKIVTTLENPDTGNVDDLYASTQPRSIFNTAPPVNAPHQGNQLGAKEKFEFLDKWKSAVFAQRTKELPEWINVFRQFKTPLHLTYLFITWFLGCGVGLVFTFLFWHLQDVGGTPTLFGICSVINHISEILAYFFSFNFIKRFGHTRVLSVGLGCNVVRFIYVAFLTNPYYALPFELVQGITHAACFAACCSTISRVAKPELRTSTQGVMQGLHHGIGRASGALIGGYVINAIGSKATFFIYGLLSGCVLAGFLYVRKKASQTEDDDVKVDDSEALGGMAAPQGVPAAIPSKLSNQNALLQDSGW